MDKIVKILAEELNIRENQVVETIKLMDEGNTVPFIARYRKEVTGGLSDEILRDFDERLTYLRNLEERKEEIIRLIEEQDKLTPELKKEILDTNVMVRLEDLYRPYKIKKKTKATKAKERGLEPLAITIYNQEDVDIIKYAMEFIDEKKEVLNIKMAIEGAMDIISEMVSDNPDFREIIRNIYFEEAVLEIKAVDETVSSVFEMYFDYSEAVNNIANHRILAINRGENQKILKVKLNAPDDKILGILIDSIIKIKDREHNELLKAITEAYKKYIAPSVEREVRAFLTERAETEAIKVFSKNTKPLLLLAPVRDTVVLAIDPSFRTGCKMAVLDKTGKLLDYATIYPNEPINDVYNAKIKVIELINKYDVDVIPIGNGTASRETEQFIADVLSEIDKEVHYTIVSEAGASVYSASKLATEEYPDLDVSIRGAISIGRRLQDPLSELVKIDTKHIGVGQYQHDLNQKKLDESLTNVVEDCVNSVGVDLNIATPSLLKYVSGISSTVSKNIVEYRNKNGRFNSRDELLKVPRLGDKVYEQAAGFLRIHGGQNVLDQTAVHPESYEQTVKLIELLGYDLKDLNKKDALIDIDSRILNYGKGKIKDNKENFKSDKKQLNSLKDLRKLKFANKKESEKAKKENIKKHLSLIADDLEIGYFTINDIVEELKKPGRDIRDEMPKPIFRKDVLTIDDLYEGLVLSATVRNVVDFGAFVDLGIKQNGLIHISNMSDKFIKNPTDILSVGDQVEVKVIQIDRQREKIGLSLKNISQKYEN